MALERLAANELAVPVTRKRFLVPLWDFILGMKLSFIASLNLLLVALSCLLIEGSLDGGEQHEHISTFQLRGRLNRGVRLQIVGETLEHTVERCVCAISRPRNMMVIFTRAPFFRKRRTWPFLVS